MSDVCVQHAVVQSIQYTIDSAIIVLSIGLGQGGGKSNLGEVTSCAACRRSQSPVNTTGQTQNTPLLAQNYYKTFFRKFTGFV